MHAAVHAPAQQAGLLQHAQVPRHRRQRHVERLRQLAGRRPAARKPLEDRPARGVREGGERRVEGLVRIVNHVVNIQGGPGRAQVKSW